MCVCVIIKCTQLDKESLRGVWSVGDTLSVVLGLHTGSYVSMDSTN